ncbi:MAG: hypothetical protein ABH828_06365 [archaeon]
MTTLRNKFNMNDRGGFIVFRHKYKHMNYVAASFMCFPEYLSIEISTESPLTENRGLRGKLNGNRTSFLPKKNHIYPDQKINADLLKYIRPEYINANKDLSKIYKTIETINLDEARLNDLIIINSFQLTAGGIVDRIDDRNKYFEVDLSPIYPIDDKQITTFKVRNELPIFRIYKQQDMDEIITRMNNK